MSRRPGLGTHDRIMNLGSCADQPWAAATRKGGTMTAQENVHRGYMVNTRSAGYAGLYRISYVPRGVQQPRTSGRAKKVPEYVATVNVPDESVGWEGQPAKFEATLEDFRTDALRRAKTIHDWL